MKSKSVEECFWGAKRGESKGKIRALIVPHAGYVYSGSVAASGYRRLKKGDYDLVKIIGFYHGPDRENEHSIKVQIPLLRYVLGEVRIEEVYINEVIDLEAKERTLVVASSDLSHYQALGMAKVMDKRSIEAIVSLDEDRIRNEADACGLVAILSLNRLAKKQGWQAKLVDYRTSAEATGDESGVVGYGCIAYTINQKKVRIISARETDKKKKKLDKKATRLAKFGNKNEEEDLEKFLLDLARRAIADPKFKAEAGELRPSLKIKHACFVTLTIGGELRGCIGHLKAVQPLYLEVMENARAAAFADPRFPPLGKEEARQVKIEISVLTEPRCFRYQSVAELIDYLEKNKPGVIIRSGWNRATFLPQVWEELPRVEDFMEHLCLKAGLSGEAWKGGQVEVETYEVKKFSEN